MTPVLSGFPLNIRLRYETDLKICCIVDCGAEATHCHFLDLDYDMGTVDLYTCSHKDHIEDALSGLHNLKDVCDAVTEKIIEQTTEH